MDVLVLREKTKTSNSGFQSFVRKPYCAINGAHSFSLPGAVTTDGARYTVGKMIRSPDYVTNISIY